MGNEGIGLKKNRGKHIVVAGGSGFIGQKLVKNLRDEGAKVTVLSRSKERGDLTWETLAKQGLPPCEAVINLAGANVMQRRWSEKVKKELYSSRIDATQRLVQAIKECDSPPSVLINASAVGYYANDSHHRWDENGPAGDHFLSQLAQQWEQTARLLEGHKTRLVLVRIGIALGLEGGALQKMLPPFRLGLGGPIGDGHQPFPWIHVDDLVGLILFSLENEEVRGAINGVAPQELDQRTFAQELGRVLRRPAFMPMPLALLKLLLGERAVVAADAPRVEPKRALEFGYTFQYPEIKAALADLLSRK